MERQGYPNLPLLIPSIPGSHPFLLASSLLALFQLTQNIKHQCMTPPYFSCFPFSQTSHLCSPLFHSFPISYSPGLPAPVLPHQQGLTITTATLRFQDHSTGTSHVTTISSCLPYPFHPPFIPALLCGSPNLPDKIGLWVFLCYSLKFSPFFSKIVWFFGHCCMYLVTDKDYFVITMMNANFDGM